MPHKDPAARIPGNRPSKSEHRLTPGSTSDSQDCDAPHLQVPKPFGKRNYIVDVSAHTRGVGYDRVWTAEISGWSEHFLTYIAACEAESQSVPVQ